jgi:sporulation protein YlmC with PRC-barrel domain
MVHASQPLYVSPVGDVLACSPIGALAQQTSPPTQQPSSPAPGADASNAKSSVQIDWQSLVGSTVRGEDGKDVDPSDGKVTSVVVTMGRTIGVGGTGVTLNGKDITVPWNDVKVGRDRDKFVVTLLQSALPTTESPTKTR